MKIRNGFVSNSSSSSFVIKVPNSFVIRVNDEKLCSRCKEYSSFLHSVKNSSYYNTKIEYGKDGILEYLNNEKKFLEENIERYSNPNVDYYLPYYYGNRDELIEEYKEDLDNINNNIEKYSNMENIYKIYIDYCDNQVNTLLDKAIEDGSIEIICEGDL